MISREPNSRDDYYIPMKLRQIFLIATSLLLGLGAAGCSTTLEKSQKTSVSSDGTVKSKETTVTQKADGTVVKEQETKVSAPARR